MPNKLEMSQTILIFERVTNTAQTDHFDWGFRFTNLYGIDYRYTTAKGYFSDQLLKHNHLYGYDPLQMQLDLYFPRVAQGMLVRMGRYISPLDIEAQLSPENFLYTHSNMYSVDPYTFTGIQATTKFNDQFQLTTGIHARRRHGPVDDLVAGQRRGPAEVGREEQQGLALRRAGFASGTAISRMATTTCRSSGSPGATSSTTDSRP